ncbi:MAG: hypothetical protein RJB66_1486 [Pseudomonadota bacterium]|jgi:uncharacterized protein YbcC (UPF0753/DUF2309 family)
MQSIDLTEQAERKSDLQTIEDVINSFRPLLPIQNPMPFFVHNNPLMYWERYSFREGLEKAVLTYENAIEVKTRVIWRDLEDFVIPLVISYFDQGLNRWIVPSKKKGLWDWYCEYIKTSWSLKSKALPPLKKDLERLTTQSPVEVIAMCLSRMAIRKEDWANHLQALIFHFKGWSGMIQVLECNPKVFPIQKYDILLMDWVAMLITAEEALRQKKQLSGQRIWDFNRLPRRKETINKRIEKIRRSEIEFYRKTISQVHSHIVAQEQRRMTERNNSKFAPAVQILFCIDDREESLRRALEKVEPSYETFGTVGFFGVDFLLKRPGHVIFQPQCPPVVTPRKRAEEIVPEGDNAFLNKVRKFIPHLNESRFTPIEPFLSFLFWPFYMVALWLRSFMPTTYSQIRDWLRYDNPMKGHNLIRFIEGYTLSEKADLVRDILGGAGMNIVQSNLVMVLGHAATTTNNPFQKSYGCGACSGQSGFANAKVFAEFANDPQVRSELKSRGILISDSTLFLACCHDTCSDKVFYAPSSDQRLSDYQEIFIKFGNDMKKALEINASERWRQFRIKSSADSTSRSLDWSQPRPEFGHTGVALSVFGPRWLTQDLDLKRRAFLISYEPENDPGGENLAYDILSALPVCANINLDYFTSSAFPKVFGAGSKLPLNIASGIGLMHGSKGDLQIGLATQMVDQHEPLRLLAFVFCEANNLQKVIQKSARLQNLINNNWIHLVRIDPKTLDFDVITEELKNAMALTQ